MRTNMQFTRINIISWLSTYGLIISLLSVHNPITTYLGYAVMIFFSINYYLYHKLAKITPELIVLLIFPVWAVLSFVNGGAISESISETRKVFFNFILILPFSFLSSVNSREIIRKLPLYSVIPALISFVLFIATGMQSRSDFLGGPNYYGPISAMLACLAFVNYMDEKKFFWLLIVAGFLLGLFSTVSGRSLLFFSVFSFLITFLYLIRKIYRSALRFEFKVRIVTALKFFSGIGLILIVAIGISDLMRAYEAKGINLYWINYAIDKATNTEANGNVARVLLYDTGIKLIESKASFFIGDGLDSTRYYFKSMVGESTYSHNNYIELIVGVGWFGTLLWVFPFMVALCSSVFYMLKERGHFLFSASLFSFILSFLLLGSFMAVYSLVLPLVTILSLYNLQKKK
ncbi:hypothetical protein PSDI105340_13905 [Pseudoalteromonas distincta]